MPLDYLVLRSLRRLVPPAVMSTLVRRRIFLTSGEETRAPEAAAERFCASLAGAGRGVAGTTALILGYGGRFSLGVELLRRGVHHVVLLDPYATVDERTNLALAGRASLYLHARNGHAAPNPDYISLVHEPIERYVESGAPQVDLVLSTSVLEHVDAPESVVSHIARLTKPDGYHVHLIDLRDHYFKYPFEMLCHGEAAWRRYLNPPTNLNRLRIWEYEALFGRYFEKVSWEPVRTDVAAFRRARPRIEPRFLSGDERLDAVTIIALHAAQPRQDARG